MEIEIKYILMVFGMFLVTYIPRYLPLAVLSKINIPEILVEWLKYIPVAILASLLAPAILMVDNKILVTHENIFLLAALPTFLIAIYKKNIFLTVLVGVTAVALLEFYI